MVTITYPIELYYCPKNREKEHKATIHKDRIDFHRSCPEARRTEIIIPVFLREEFNCTTIKKGDSRYSEAFIKALYPVTLQSQGYTLEPNPAIVVRTGI